MTDHFEPPPPPTPADVILACETLMRAGFVEEGLAVLARVAPDRKALIKLLAQAEARYA
jgi:hypothetical protein